MKQKLFFLSIAIESALIIFLGVGIYQKYNSNMIASISVIDRERVTLGEGELKYFYEPLAGADSIGFEGPEWLDHNPIYTINSNTLNDGSEYQIQKPEDTYRIVTIGDSFTFGLYVNTQDSYPETLERLLNDKSCKNQFEVINLGIPGYDIQYSVERFKQRGAKYNPDLVVWLILQGNFSKIQELIAKRVDRDYEVKDEEAADQARRDILSEVGEKNIIEYQNSFLAAFGDLYKESLLMYSFEGWLWGEQEKNVKTFVQNHPLGHFYKSSLNLKEEDALFPDYHPDKRGHLLIAQDLSDYLLKNNIIPCD